MEIVVKDIRVDVKLLDQEQVLSVDVPRALSDTIKVALTLGTYSPWPHIAVNLVFNNYTDFPRKQTYVVRGEGSATIWVYPSRFPYKSHTHLNWSMRLCNGIASAFGYLNWRRAEIEGDPLHRMGKSVSVEDFSYSVYHHLEAYAALEDGTPREEEMMNLRRIVARR